MSTWADLKSIIQNQYDLTEETFIQEDELIQYANAAISDIEKEIHALDDQGSKYFHAEATLNLVTGTSTYDLPTDLYANKITGVYFNDGGTKYEIKPLTNLNDIMYINDDDFYCYRIISTSANGMKIKLYPASRSTDSTSITIFYRRKANRIVNDSTIVDIPEGDDFIIQNVIDKAANKERMMPDAPESAESKRKRELLISSLTNQIDDDNNDVIVSYDHYEGSV